MFIKANLLNYKMKRLGLFFLLGMFLISSAYAQTYDFNEGNLFAEHNRYVYTNVMKDNLKGCEGYDCSYYSELNDKDDQLKVIDGYYAPSYTKKTTSAYQIFMFNSSNELGIKNIQWKWVGFNDCYYDSYYYRIASWESSLGEWIVLDSFSVPRDSQVTKEILVNDSSLYSEGMNYFMVWQDKKSCKGFGKPLLTDYIEAEVEYNSCDEENTTIFVDTRIEGDYKEKGDTFNFIVNVTNIGIVNAYNLEAEFFPNGWSVNSIQPLPTIEPGKSEEVSFQITRSEQDGYAFASVRGCNILPTSSDTVNIPIFWFISLAIGMVIVGLGAYFKLNR